MIRVLSLIVSDESRRGRGTEDDPHRAIYQVWTPDGQLLAELDYPENYNGHGDAWNSILRDTR